MAPGGEEEAEEAAPGGEVAAEAAAGAAVWGTRCPVSSGERGLRVWGCGSGARGREGGGRGCGEGAVGLLGEGEAAWAWGAGGLWGRRGVYRVGGQRRLEGYEAGGGEGRENVVGSQEVGSVGI